TKDENQCATRSWKKPARFFLPQFLTFNSGAAKSRNRSQKAHGKKSRTLESNCSMNVSSAANTTRLWPKRSLSACRVSGIRSRRGPARGDAPRQRTSTVKGKATSPKLVRPPRKRRSKSRAKPTPKQLPFTPQHSIRLMHKNFIRFFEAST